MMDFNLEHTVIGVLVLIGMADRIVRSRQMNGKTEELHTQQIQLYERLARLEQRMSTEESRAIPPPWFADQVRRLETNMERLLHTPPPPGNCEPRD